MREEDEGAQPVDRGGGGGRRHRRAQRGEPGVGARGIPLHPAVVRGEGERGPEPPARCARVGTGPFEHLPRLRDVAELHEGVRQRHGGGPRPLPGPAGEAAG
ncbi:hypothetical protein AT728_07070 [Streptomyces silvensis]|uniref:Uncharacterized protein n=1 Tax=Streptomyces silvensis TaxID=1765722 RepID=A0A0W7X796_9ACTN|nr:hypothetical protein AT728_07070 [Streptomyces silvensis]